MEGERMMKRSLLFFGLLLSSSLTFALDMNAPKVGTYRGQNCKVVVAPYFQTYLEIRATRAPDAMISILYKPSTSEFFDPTPLWRGGESSAAASEFRVNAGTDQMLTLQLRFGGKMEGRDLKTTLSIDPQSGQLLAMKGDLQIAVHSYADGRHSGPLKELFAAVDCSMLHYLGPQLQ